jgi:glutamate-1-semialdehyde-2,1-aminomutase
MSSLNLRKSHQYWQEAQQLIPTGTQMMSKTPSQFVLGEYPLYLQSGKGSHVWDVDGNEFIDYMCAFGTVMLGYADAKVNAAVRAQLEDGIIYSLPHILELEVAELLHKLIPSAEQVRFFKTGSEATSAAVRVARAATGRDIIAKCAAGYHGWHDWHAIGSGRAAGIPRHNQNLLPTFPYNDVTALDEIFRESPKQVAAVMMEPVVLDEPKDSFLEKVRDLAHANGALLIFDEIVSGFRHAPGGAQQLYNVTPDLSCFGKGMANGLPLSAVVGSRSAMARFEDANVFVSTTFGGDAISLAAAKVVLEVVANGDVVEHIWTLGARLQEGLRSIAMRLDVPIDCKGTPSRMVLTYVDKGTAIATDIRALFLQECIRRGILFGNVVFIGAAHKDEDISRTLEVAETAMKTVRSGIEEGDLNSRIAGAVPADIFRPRTS